MIRTGYILATLSLLALSGTARAEQQHNSGFQQQQGGQYQGSMAMGASGGAMGGGASGAGAKYEKNKDVTKSQEYAKESIKEMNEGNKSFGQSVEKMSSSFGQALEKTKIPENNKMLEELAKNATNVPSGEGIGKAAVDDLVAATKSLSEVQTQTVQAFAQALIGPPKPAVEVVQAPTVADKMASFVSGRVAGGGARGGSSPLGLAATAQPIGSARGVASIPSRGAGGGRGVTSIDPGLTYKAPSLRRKSN